MNATKIIFIPILMILSLPGFSQRDTTKKSVDITSAFRPSLKPVGKINFTAIPPTADTSKPRLQYDIPNPNLLFAYQPGSLKPLALTIDSNARFDNSNYIKAGFGSLRTPYIQAGFSFGDGNTAGGNIYAKHVSSQGNREYQDFSSTQVKLSGFYKAIKNKEWNASLGIKSDKTYKYGFTPSTLSFPDDSVRVTFQTYSARVGVHNINTTAYGINYAPELKIDVFSDHLNTSESNTVLDLPLEKTLGKDFLVKLGVTFDLTRLSPKSKSAINNTMYYISPAIVYRTPTLMLQGGIRPSWDNGTFKMFPNIVAEVGTEDQRLTFQAGWTGYIRKTSYQYLASINPWLWVPSNLNNTWIEERYAGFKGSVGDHFTYSSKLGFNKLNNQPLFINDTSFNSDRKSFQVVNEKRLNVLSLSGELGFNVEEKFSLITGVQFNKYGAKNNEKAWGLLPLELTAAMRLQIIKDLWLKSDVFAFSGPRFLKADKSAGKQDGAIDLNAGLEFKITKSLNLWTQFNNIFNKEYQRWNGYPAYGFNFVGGIIFNFDQKTK